MRVFNKNSSIFHLLSEAIMEGTLVVNQDQLIVSVNRRAGELFGYKPDGLIGKSIQQLIPKDNRESHDKEVRAFFADCKKLRMAEGRRVHGLRKNGEVFPIEVGLNPFTIYNRNYVLALVYDLTETRDYQKRLAIRGQALESASNGIVITDAMQKDQPIIYHNKAFAAMTGYSSADILGRNCRFLQGKDRDQEGARELRDAVRKGESCRVVLRNYRKDGSLFWNEISINPIRALNGDITHFVGVLDDITTRINAEQQIRHFGNIFEESLNEIYVFDALDFHFTRVNRGALESLGYSWGEMKKMTALDILPELGKTKFRRLIRPLRNDPSKKIDFESIQRRKDGSSYPVEIHMQGSKLGEQELVVAIVMDITERLDYTRKLEKTVEERTEQLREALEKEKELNELKSKFLSMVSHEFKTPLSAILTAATLTGKYTGSEQQPRRDKHLKSIKAEVHHLTSILNDFLSVERIEKGKEVYQIHSFNLSKVINEVVYAANMLLKTGQQINYPMNIEEVRIRQDERIVALTLTNLLYNAIKYSPEHTVIDLDVDVSLEEVRFVVRDRGIGIPKKEQKHIFERYFRAGNVLTTQGTGIGLNIVKTHLENLGGTVEFSSEEGVGSSFTAIFPLDGDLAAKKTDNDVEKDKISLEK